MGYLTHRVDQSEVKPGDHVYTWRTAYTYAHHGIYVGENRVIHFTNQGNDISGNGWSLPFAFSSSIPNISASCLYPFDASSSHGSENLSSYCSSVNHDLQDSCLSSLYCGFHHFESGVVLSCLNCFKATGSLHLYRYEVSKYEYVSKIRGGTCTIAKSDPPLEVIHRAICLLQNGFGSYDLVQNNCEDFALYCKTGLLICDQPTQGSSGQVNFVANVPWKPMVSFALQKTVSSSLGGVSVVVGVGKLYWDRYKSDIGVRVDVKKVHVENFSSFRNH